MAGSVPGRPSPEVEAFVGRLADDLSGLDKELGEVDLLITQAKAEATRHETRRAGAADKLTAAAKASSDPTERLDQAASLVTLTKRAALMETQVDVLEGKRRALGRFRDALAGYVAALPALDAADLQGTLALGPGGSVPGTATVMLGGPGTTGETALPIAVSRLVLSAQEDLRREIARAMHDGPAQSLTNIVLQAQIVERLVARDPDSAGGEVRQLIAMVRHTLDATKSFIFDVRPMVLDDLGLVPTLRRSTRERSRRAGIPVEFDSMGQDRRLAMDLESGLFRMLDEALAAYLGGAPDRVSLRLDWGDQLEARMTAIRAAAARPTGLSAPGTSEDLPPALAAMIEDRRADERDAAAAALRDAIVVLPPSVWREIQGRAASSGVTAELVADGSELRLVAEIPPIDSSGGATPALTSASPAT